jgi:hypothetical protein
MVYSELEVLHEEDILYPMIDEKGDYCLKTKSNDWLMKIDNQGVISLNSNLMNVWPYGYVTSTYIFRLFGVYINFIHRYRKDRIYIHREFCYVSWKELLNGADGRVRRYIFCASQPLPIKITLLGDVLSGAVEYQDRKAGYTSKW